MWLIAKQMVQLCQFVWVGGVAIGTGGLKCSNGVKSGLLMNASSCFGFHFGICIFNARATLLEVEIHERPEEITLTSSVCFRLRFIFLLPKFFLGRYFLWFTIYCSRVLPAPFWAVSRYIVSYVPFGISFVSGSKFCNVPFRDTNLWPVWFFYYARCWADFSVGAHWGKDFVEPV